MRDELGRFKKGHGLGIPPPNIGMPAWNHGLTKENDERVRGYSEKRKIWWEKHPKAHNEQSVRMKKRWSVQTFRKKMLDQQCPICYKLFMKNKPHNCQCAVNFRCEKCGILISNKKIHKCPMEDKKLKEKYMKAALRGLLKRPTKLEFLFIKFFKKYGFPFQYCGDGDVFIGGKNPDFKVTLNIKAIIEVANKIEKSLNFRNRSYKSWSEYEKQRVYHFSKYGWNCLVIWEEELKNKEMLLKKVQRFIWESIPVYQPNIIIHQDTLLNRSTL